MGRSSNPRHPLPAERGAKRIGAIGTIVPGDDVEVAREIARIWDWLGRLRIPKALAAIGIQFDVNNGLGEDHYLKVYTQDSDGINFIDQNVAGGYTTDVEITALDGFTVTADGPLSKVQGVVAGPITLESTADSIALLANSAGQSVDIEGNDNVNVYASGGELKLQGTNTRVQLLTGGKLYVKNNGGTVIFEVREDGSVHIPTGTSVVADL